MKLWTNAEHYVHDKNWEKEKIWIGLKTYQRLFLLNTANECAYRLTHQTNRFRLIDSQSIVKTLKRSVNGPGVLNLQNDTNCFIRCRKWDIIQNSNILENETRLVRWESHISTCVWRQQEHLFLSGGQSKTIPIMQPQKNLRSNRHAIRLNSIWVIYRTCIYMIKQVEPSGILSEQYLEFGLNLKE